MKIRDRWIIVSSFIFIALGLAYDANAQCVVVDIAPSPEFCSDLDKSGTINVTCPYDEVNKQYSASGSLFANPEDDCDDTAAIQAALNRSGGWKTVYLPAGNSAQPYYFISSPLNVGAKRIVGNHVVTSVNVKPTRLKIATGASLASGTVSSGEAGAIPPDKVTKDIFSSGAVLYATSGKTHIENLVIEGDDVSAVRSADFGTYINKSHSSRVRNVTGKFMRKSDIYVDESADTVLESVHTEYNDLDGIVMVSSNGSTVRESISNWNKRHGFVVSYNPLSLYAGSMTLMNCSAEGNSSTTEGLQQASYGADVGHGIYVVNTKPIVRVMNCRLEGNKVAGIRAENARNVHILHNRIIPGASIGFDADGNSLNHAIELAGCQRCIVRGNQVSGGGADKNRIDIWVTGNYRYPYIAENIYDGHSGAGAVDNVGGGEKFQVVVEGSMNFNQHQTKHLHAAAPPNSGKWRTGDIVWNSQPASGEPIGWVCGLTDGTHSYTCTQWSEFGDIK